MQFVCLPALALRSLSGAGCREPDCMVGRCGLSECSTACASSRSEPVGDLVEDRRGVTACHRQDGVLGLGVLSPGCVQQIRGRLAIMTNAIMTRFYSDLDVLGFN